jgi:uncharacterized protein YaaW (UPF0174 family)
LKQAIKKSYNNTHKSLIDAIHHRNSLKVQYHRIRNRVSIINQHNPKFVEPVKLLKDSDSSVLECLAKILETNDKSPEKLVSRLDFLSQGIFGRTFGAKPTYKEIVETACKKLNLPKPSSPYQGEQSIAIHCFKEMYQKLSPFQKEEYEDALKKQGELLRHLNPSLAPSMISAGAIISGRMSGFGVYLAASTVVGAITSTIGITLPFIFYTTMSSAISIFLGPVGWIAVGAMVIGTIFGPDFSKVTQGIILIASLRAEKELEWQVLLGKARKELKSLSREIRSNFFKIIVLTLTLLLFWCAIPLLTLLVVILVIKLHTM